MDAVTLVVAILAVYRITRFVTRDDGPWKACRKLREWAATDFDQDGSPENFWGALLSCPWCLNFWVACAAVLWLAFGPAWGWWLLVPWALAAGTGILARWNDGAE